MGAILDRPAGVFPAVDGLGEGPGIRYSTMTRDLTMSRGDGSRGNGGGSRGRASVGQMCSKTKTIRDQRGRPRVAEMEP
jgi:hypothetical protein